MLAKLQKKHDTIYLHDLEGSKMVSTQDAGIPAAADIDRFCLESSLIVKSSQTGPGDLQGSAKPGICKHVLTSIHGE